MAMKLLLVKSFLEINWRRKICLETLFMSSLIICWWTLHEIVVIKLHVFMKLPLLIRLSWTWYVVWQIPTSTHFVTTLPFYRARIKSPILTFKKTLLRLELLNFDSYLLMLHLETCFEHFFLNIKAIYSLICVEWQQFGNMHIENFLDINLDSHLLKVIL